MKRPINQHWVPQFYLKGFSTPETRGERESQVWIFSKNDEDGEERLTNIRNVCAKRYLYAPKDQTGNRSWETDERLNKMETLLSSIWAEIGSGFVDFQSEHIRNAVALFVASIHIRHPRTLEKIEAIHDRIVQFLESAPKSPDGTPNIDGYVYEGTEFGLDTSGWIDFKSAGKDEHHRFFNKMILEQTGYFATQLSKKRWSVVFSERDEFITSDSPVSIRDKMAFGCGINTKGAVISFPLSPTRILVMDDKFEEPANQYYALKPGNIGSFNFGIWHATARFLVTGRSVQDVLKEMLVWAEGEGYA